MSLSPANILQRLQELKTWQENHEELLKKTKNLINPVENLTTASDYESIEGLSAFDTSVDENRSKPAQNWESQAISPTKSFDQLLEEKLAEDHGPTGGPQKPKQPFLKKGSGLQRFRMPPQRKTQSRKVNKPKSKTPESRITPLRAPDFAVVKPKATWKKIEETAQIDTPKEVPSEQTLYEKALEKELLIFEALEERADNSSFCSTNSSVMRILSSTPSKKNKDLPPPITEEKRVRWESHSEDEDFIESTLEKTDIAEILMRLRNLAENKTKVEKPPSPIESSEDEKWTETSSSDTSISSTDLEKTLQTVEKRDIGIGTGETNEYSENNCAICGEKFEKKLMEYERKIREVMEDKNRIQKITNELSRKEQDFLKKKQLFEEEKASLVFDLESEKKKLLKERQVYQTYVKDSQNRPNKREREEISNLKQEVADLKETLKLKDTKNGMTQARLRNQVKQLEKENSNLKDEIEKLTKENAKLSATQKLNRRPSDKKILHEINKNISKLTQETLKSKRNDEAQVVQKHNSFERKEDLDDSLLEMANSRVSDYTEVEKQYENTFRNDSGHNLSRAEPRIKDKKIEKTLEDGSKYVKYPNGNEKTVSQDGNFITMKYFNGDIQETNLLDGTVKYFFSAKNIWQTTYADGFELVEFPDGIKERRYVDGKCEVILPDDVIQITLPDGSQETKYPDGSRVSVKNNGDKVLFLPNGQKEIETREYKKREYPDGTVKILYPDGTQETRYSNGRVRIKDKNGTLILDTQS